MDHHRVLIKIDYDENVGLYAFIETEQSMSAVGGSTFNFFLGQSWICRTLGNFSSSATGHKKLAV